MEPIRELLFISGKKCDIYDAETGEHCLSYTHSYDKIGRQCTSKTLNVLDDHHMIGAIDNSIAVWDFSKSDKTVTTLSDKVSVLIASSCGRYIVAGVRDSVYLWEVRSGTLFGKAAFCSADITCMKFDLKNNFVFIGYSNGYLFSCILQELVLDCKNKPSLKCKSDHTSAITDIYSGLDRVVTVAADNYCLLYDAKTMCPISKMRFENILTSVILDPLENYIIIGDEMGYIHRITLRDVHFGLPDWDNNIKAHETKIISLSYSKVRHNKFLSSSENDCKIWNLETMACIQVFSNTGISSAFLSPNLPGITKKSAELPMQRPALQTRCNEVEPGSKIPYLMIGVPHKHKLTLPQFMDNQFYPPDSITGGRGGDQNALPPASSDPSTSRSNYLAQEIRKIHEQMYQHILRK